MKKAVSVFLAALCAFSLAMPMSVSAVKQSPSQGETVDIHIGGQGKSIEGGTTGIGGGEGKGEGEGETVKKTKDGITVSYDTTIQTKVSGYGTSIAKVETVVYVNGKEVDRIIMDRESGTTQRYSARLFKNYDIPKSGTMDIYVEVTDKSNVATQKLIRHIAADEYGDIIPETKETVIDGDFSGSYDAKKYDTGYSVGYNGTASVDVTDVTEPIEKVQFVEVLNGQEIGRYDMNAVEGQEGQYEYAVKRTYTVQNGGKLEFYAEVTDKNGKVYRKLINELKVGDEGQLILNTIDKTPEDAAKKDPNASPKTNDIASVLFTSTAAWTVAGILLIALGVLFLRKRKVSGK